MAVDPRVALGDYVTERAAELAELERRGEFTAEQVRQRQDELMMTMAWLRDHMAAEVEALRQQIADDDG